MAHCIDSIQTTLNRRSSRKITIHNSFVARQLKSSVQIDIGRRLSFKVKRYHIMGEALKSSRTWGNTTLLVRTTNPPSTLLPFRKTDPSKNGPLISAFLGTGDESNSLSCQETHSWFDTRSFSPLHVHRLIANRASPLDIRIAWQW